MQYIPSTLTYYLQDRYADALVVPSIDASQDWKLEFGKRENQYLILAFNRSFITCDPKDLDIEVSTSLIIYNYIAIILYIYIIVNVNTVYRTPL